MGLASSMPNTIDASVAHHANLLFKQKYDAWRAKFPHSEYTEDLDTQAVAERLGDGMLCMGLLRTCDEEAIAIPGCMLVEALQFAEGLYGVAVIRRDGSTVSLPIPKSPYCEEVDSVSISTICTQDGPYREWLPGFVQHFAGMDIVHDIAVAYYGDTPPSGLPDKCRVDAFTDAFHMSQARNRSLRLCETDYTFMLDVDTTLTNEQVDSYIRALTQTCTHGVISLRNTEKGYPSNGMYFGATRLLADPGLCERFTGCFFEDTEYLMNFSRMGIIPHMDFSGFTRANHDRGRTTGLKGNNGEVFFEILKAGKR